MQDRSPVPAITFGVAYVGRSVLALLSLTLSLITVCEAQTWRRAYGAYGEDQARVVRWNGGDVFFVAGSTGSFGAGSSDIYLMALDGMGNRLWSTTIGGPALEIAMDLRIMSNGDLLIAGYTNEGGDYNGLLVRTTATGDVIWQGSYGGSDWDFLNELLPLPDGGLVAVGQTFSMGIGGDAWLLQVNDLGDVMAERSYGAAGEQAGNAICLAPDGYMIAGSNGVGESSDALAIRLNGNLDTNWSSTFGGNSMDVVFDVVATLDGAFSMVGTTRSYSIWEEGYHLKIDAEGQEVWHRNWGQVNDQGSYEHVELANGEFVTVGYTKTSGGGERDMYLLKSYPDGDFGFGRTFGGAEDDVAIGLDTTDTGFVCAGWSDSYGAGGRDVFVVRCDVDGVTASEFVEADFDPVSVRDSDRKTLVIHPNPNQGAFMFNAPSQGTWAIFNHTGRGVGAGIVGTTQTQIVMDIEPGMYTLRVVGSAGERSAQQFVVLRP